MSRSRKAVGRMGHSENLRVYSNRCPECGSDNGHGCGAAWHDKFRGPILRGENVKGCGCKAVCDCEHCR